MSTPPDARRPEITRALARGVQRLWIDRNYAPVLELTLGNGRRADVAAIGPKGDIVIVETKSGVEDYVVDFKWPEYRDYCDAFYFAVTEDFPRVMIPEEAGLIIADGFGGEIIREAPRLPLAGARRKAVTLAFARAAASRLFGAPLPETITPT
ncbi:MAG: DNA repair putative endonuclease MmcB [Hyphomonadaceae bacterium]|nr:DNA repair putative endonuclease MmcB [Hyphomonadaceae bacterium]